MKTWLRKLRKFFCEPCSSLLELLVLLVFLAAAFSFMLYITNWDWERQDMLLRTAITAPEPERCALCGAANSPRFQTTLCIVDLSTGMLTPLAHNVQNTPYAALAIPQKTGRMDPTQFCRDCRAKLVPVALEGYVLADLSDPENIQIYPITDGAEYELCGYMITITQDKRNAGPTITMTASE